MSATKPEGWKGFAVAASFMIGGFLFFLFLLFGPSSRHTTAPPDPATLERREAWRTEKLERERARNYVENIKPHVPAR